MKLSKLKLVIIIKLFINSKGWTNGFSKHTPLFVGVVHGCLQMYIERAAATDHPAICCLSWRSFQKLDSIMTHPSDIGNSV